VSVAAPGNELAIQFVGPAATIGGRRMRPSALFLRRSNTSQMRWLMCSPPRAVASRATFANASSAARMPLERAAKH
jgi:hypothetical protein